MNEPADRGVDRLHASRVDGAGAGTPLEPRPAATVVLLRDGPDGRLETLLARRPSTMVFAADMHVFPGGRVDAADADPRLARRSVISPATAAADLGGDLQPDAALAAYVAAIREAFEEAGVLFAVAPAGADLDRARARLLQDPGAFPDLADALDLRLRTDLLVPLSRWVTPPGLSRRFDTRFFAAMLPAGAEPTLVGEEVVLQAWRAPSAALDAMAAGMLSMWLPTSTTLQQLAHVESIDPDHAAGAESLRERLGIPVHVGDGGGRQLPYATLALEDGSIIDAGDVPLRIVATPGPRPDHVACIVGAGDVVLSGDLDGIRGARSVLAPVDGRALQASVERLRALAPGAAWLGGHPNRS